MKNKKTLFNELTGKDKKYDSIVDEYRRIYQIGNVIKIKNNDLNSRQKMFKIGVAYILKSLKIKKKLKNIFVGINLNNEKSKYKKIEVISFKNNEKEKEFSFEAIDKNENKIIISFSILKPWIFSNSNKIEYYERYKFNKTLYGLSDSYKKILLKKRCEYKTAILVDNICKKLKIELPIWANKKIKKYKSKGEISIN